MLCFTNKLVPCLSLVASSRRRNFVSLGAVEKGERHLTMEQNLLLCLCTDNKFPKISLLNYLNKGTEREGFWGFLELSKPSQLERQ